MAPATGMLSRGPPGQQKLGKGRTRQACRDGAPHAPGRARAPGAGRRGVELHLSAMAAPITIVDDGADDNVGQKDLNQLTVDSAANPPAVSWNWDDTAWSGATPATPAPSSTPTETGLPTTPSALASAATLRPSSTSLSGIAATNGQTDARRRVRHTFQPIRHSRLRSSRTPIRSGTTLRIPPLTARRRVLRPAPTA